MCNLWPLCYGTNPVALRIINQNKLIATAAGNYQITFTITDVDIKYFYTFEVEVKEKTVSQYSISVIGVENDSYTMPLTNTTEMLGYLVTKSGNSSNINQKASVISDNNSVATAEIMGIGFIYIQAISVGEANITLTYLADNSVTYTFKIIII